MIDQHTVTIERRDDVDSVREFAASFNHYIEFTPVHLINLDGRTIGYLEMKPHMVVYPALHPGLFTPRIFHEVGWKVVDALKRSFGDPWILESPQAVLGPRRMAHIGLKPLRFNVYEVVE